MNKYLFISIMMVSLAIFLAGCTASPKRNFLDQDLLLDPSVVPEVWVNIDWRNVPFDDEQGQVSGAFATFQHSLRAGIARFGENVYRYANLSKAKRHYLRMEKDYLGDSFYKTKSVYIPNGFAFTSQSADEWRFGCYGDNFFYENATLCQYLGRYAEFVIFISFSQQIDGEENISMDDIQRILIHVDELVTSKLSEDGK